MRHISWFFFQVQNDHGFQTKYNENHHDDDVQPVTERLQYFFFDGFLNAVYSPSDWFLLIDL